MKTDKETCIKKVAFEKREGSVTQTILEDYLEEHSRFCNYGGMGPRTDVLVI